MRIVIFRGLFGIVFSTGMDDLAGKIKKRGWKDVSVNAWIFRTSIENSVIKWWKSLSPAQRAQERGVVVGGHSLGGNSANYMANNLVKAGVPVLYVFTVDPTEPRNNPKGVKADNFMSNDFRAEKVPGANNILYPELNHIQVDKDIRVHRVIIAAIAEAAW
jgi:predicted alpha/beta-hydrolase family hydrolase